MRGDMRCRMACPIHIPAQASSNEGGYSSPDVQGRARSWRGGLSNGRGRCRPWDRAQGFGQALPSQHEHRSRAAERPLANRRLASTSGYRRFAAPGHCEQRIADAPSVLHEEGPCVEINDNALGLPRGHTATGRPRAAGGRCRKGLVTHGGSDQQPWGGHACWEITALP